MNCGKEEEKTMTAKTTDKELLELAAKAAGFGAPGSGRTIWTLSEYPKRSGRHGALWNYVGNMDAAELWNPLADDGDALRLVFKLGLRVCIDNRAGFSWIKRFEDSTAHGDDAASATRRAIVRAAAEIGKTMP